MLKKLAHIAAGEDASLYVDQNGRLWAWGEPDNIFPICYFPPRFLPTQIPVLGDVAEIAVSNRSELLLKKDGTLTHHDTPVPVRFDLKPDGLPHWKTGKPCSGKKFTHPSGKTEPERLKMPYP